MSGSGFRLQIYLQRSGLRLTSKEYFRMKNPTKKYRGVKGSAA